MEQFESGLCVIKLRPNISDIRVQITLLIIAFVAAYHVPLKSMANIWWSNDDYSYGFLIPLVSAYIIWDKRKKLKEITVGTSWGILPILFIFLLISLYGVLGSSGNVSMPSVPILIILFTGFCFGTESLKRLILPLGFLFFMVPVPAVIERTLGMHLKTLSTALGGAMISLFSIPVHVSGNVIDLGITQLQVVDACSGLRYIFPLLAIGVLYAYFFERILWKRLFCVLVTIPLGVILNAFRIGVTGILASAFSPKVSDGFFHGFSGWILFVVAFGMLFLISRLLNLIPSQLNSEKAPTVPKNSHTAFAPLKKNSTTGAFLISFTLLSSVAAFSLSTGSLPAITIEGGIQSFPLHIEEWSGRREIVDPVIIDASGAEEAFNGYYLDTAENEISLYIGYRSTAFLENENFFHSPTVCLPSSGWVEQYVERKTIDNIAYFNNIDVTKMVIEKSGDRKLVYFWFQTKDRATHDKNINRFHLSLHAILRDNTHDLFIRTITPIYSTENTETAELRLDMFTRQMMPVLLGFLEERQMEESRSGVRRL
jgi:exosortase D (VPLPA-CTERM-specific)